ncbi:DNA mismatch repair protein [Vibrio sp. LaRot3]|uniref:DNA mismatch repair protein n=1 Tax=Vibrio sp. LaRot3 TaxID=2998829 RepID=UPI0022CE0C7C|nr:DNA mismatch repair protein [Vibrio sp. LaRot3]MDA0149851.1 DNA mismatch repair protein [Vibrio sp. LaRot3]
MVIRKGWPPAWLLVLIGLVLNVLAILMSSIVLEKLSGNIAMLDENKQENIYSIQLVWNSVETLERKREVLLTHLKLSEIRPSQELDHAMAMQLREWVAEPIPLLNTANVTQLMERIDDAQQIYRDQIDEYYLENLTLSDEMNILNERIAWYRNIGLFLQVFGLALILARDLARKP